MTTFYADLMTGLDSRQKIFTDSPSVSLFILLWNAFNGQNSFDEIKLRGDDNPSGAKALRGFHLPCVLMATTDVEIVKLAEELVYRPEVVAVLHHWGLDYYNSYRTLILIMRSDEDAQRFVGMIE